MADIFIRKIHIDKVRHLEKVCINLSDTERKHLIITGKNGSGKTSMLEMMKYVIKLQQFNTPTNQRIGGVAMSYSLSYQSMQALESLSDFTCVYIPARRHDFTRPTSIELIQIENKTSISENVSKEFLKYMLSLDYQLYSAKINNDSELEARIEKWFDNLLRALRNIYNCQELNLQRDAKNLAFKIEMPKREPFALDKMSDGYAAFLEIVMELLMRLESNEAIVEYEKPAIVLIDEIEAHLHVELQKRILPFLTQMFPNVQFIVSTHSPFVITSLENAIVFDLEKKEQLENPSFYSFETIVESFLDTDKYSNILKKYFARYKELCFKDRTPAENEEFLRTKAELEIMSLPSTELYIAFQELEQKRKAAING